MKLHNINQNNIVLVNAYSNSSISVGDKKYENSIIITPKRVMNEDAINSIHDIGNSTLDRINNYNPEIVIIGSGNKLLFPSKEVYNYFTQRKIGLEIMDSGAACRTFNILASEERNVLALLLLAN